MSKQACFLWRPIPLHPSSEGSLRLPNMLNAGARSKVSFVNLREERVPGPSKDIHCAIIYSYPKVNLGKTNLKKKN